jgi:hypothetical protein
MAGHRIVTIVFVLVAVVVPAAASASIVVVAQGEAQRTMDATRRLELYQRINRLWVETAAAVPLYQQLDLYGVSRRLEWKARGDERIKGYDMALRDAGSAR